MSIKRYCWFKYQNGENDFWYADPGNCYCGSPKEYFSNDYTDRYCCVHQNSSIGCQIDGLTNMKWCPKATLLSKTHICNNSCLYSNQEICPSNPEACMNDYYGCDGRQRCEAFCTGPLENFPYYNQKTKKCVNDYAYCGQMDEAKYHNHQCFTLSRNHLTYTTLNSYRCLNRKDISETVIRNSATYNNFVSTRKNLFQYFKANDTMNQLTKTQIICGHQEIAMNCSDTSLIECKKEETDSGGISISNQDICDALDLLEDKGLRAPLDWTTHIYSSPEKLGM